MVSCFYFRYRQGGFIMHRYALINKEINKGIDPNESKDVVIQQWSPNNVRRLVIGVQYALVEYHTTNHKFKQKIDLIHFKNSTNEDTTLIQTNPTKHKSVLKCLTDGRVCSAIEEIIFLQPNYPQSLLSVDSNWHSIGQTEQALASRFPRLYAIAVANVPEKQIAELMKQTTNPKDLLTQHLQKQGVQVSYLTQPHKEDWWAGVPIRPKYYSMDSPTLEKIFTTLKEEQEAIKRQEELNSIDYKRNKDLIDQHLQYITALAQLIQKNEQLAEEVFDNATFLSKAEWASTLHNAQVHKVLRKELNKVIAKTVEDIQSGVLDKQDTNAQRIIGYRKINFELLLSAFQRFNVQPQAIESLKYIRQLTFEHILKHEEEYKRESNKLDLKSSLTTYKSLLNRLYKLQVNIIYLAYTKYLSRNTPKYANFFFDRLKTDIHTIKYTRRQMEFCNNYLNEGYAKESLDNTDAQEILVDDFSIRVSQQEAERILTALKTSN